MCVCLCVCLCVFIYEVPLDDWANGGSLDVFYTYDEYGFSYMGI